MRKRLGRGEVGHVAQKHCLLGERSESNKHRGAWGRIRVHCHDARLHKPACRTMPKGCFRPYASPPFHSQPYGVRVRLREGDKFSSTCRRLVWRPEAVSTQLAVTHWLWKVSVHIEQFAPLHATPNECPSDFLFNPNTRQKRTKNIFARI
jgi:hypothetical protein